MKKLNSLLLTVLLLDGLVASAAPPDAWQHTQSFEVASPGLVKISLPPATLDAARPALEDLRLHDATGNELPFLITRPVPADKAVRSAKSFQVSLNPTATVVTLETGLTQPIDGVTLESPAQNFIKAVRVESSDDGRSWRTLTQGQPVFRQPYGAGNLKVTFPPTSARWLRLTVDDQRSQPVPFTGFQIHAATTESTPCEWENATITERNENPGETRLTLNLGAANLDIASVQIDTDEPLFTRTVTLAVPQVTEAGVFEQVVGQGVIYRVAVEGQPAAAGLSVTLNAKVLSRELILLIRNDDSPPLAISAVRTERRPVYLTFMARQPGTFHLLTGNKTCAAPRYDLAALGTDLKNAVLAPVKISLMTDNPDYRAPETLGGLEMRGASLDVSDWKYRKPIQLTRNGAQQIELDLDVLAHASASLADLRVMHGSNQVPFIVQRTSISRTIKPTVIATNDAKNPNLSRWLIKLPKLNLPLNHLTCTSPTPLFQRNISLSAEFTDERGGTFFPRLGSATWTQTPEHKSKEFSFSWDVKLQGDTLILETENGDNPPIELENFTLSYPATRVLFKAGADEEVFLYYANPRAQPPSYDLNLMAGGLLTADKAPARLGAEQQMKKSSWTENQASGKGGILFWGILALVVVGLLLIISRLLPKTPTSS